MTRQLADHIQDEFLRQTTGDIRVDKATRVLYSTDASIYKIEPLGVFFPKTEEDLSNALRICSRNGISIIPRGSGSSLAGQAIGPGLVFDMSRYYPQNIVINPEEKSAFVNPGVCLERLNKETSRFGLMFGPDPASADRATIGGTIANNATGAHSILFGMSADHLISAEVVLWDGSTHRFAAESIEHVRTKVARREFPSVLQSIYSSAVEIRDNYTDTIIYNWPNVWRRASGYNLNYLFGWSPTSPPQWGGDWNSDFLPYPPVDSASLNLAPLFAGSEGTLGLLQKIEVRLVPKLKHTLLVVLEYRSVVEACESTPQLLKYSPSAVELIPGTLIELARSVPAYAHQLSFVTGTPPAILVVEFCGDSPDELLRKTKTLFPNGLIAHTPQQQNQVWNIRKMGLGLLSSRPGDIKPLAYIEDLSVPVDRLGEFSREIEQIMANQGTTGEFYAHASAGCLHIRPLLNIKNEDQIRAMRVIAEEAIDLTIGLGGAVSGEHGDGLARTEWMERAFGKDVIDLFRKIKFSFDPNNLMNPGKIINGQKFDENMRIDNKYSTKPWQTKLDFSYYLGLDGAIEMCNGAGVCRKETGLMCPSFQATREEEHSTRGRANLLREFISGGFDVSREGESTVYNALSLCLACKGCKSECPSAVDMAKLKYEFLSYYHQTHPRRFRDYLFANIGRFAKAGQPVSKLVNAAGQWSFIRRIGQDVFGITRHRHLPMLGGTSKSADRIRPDYPTMHKDSVLPVFLLSDVFSRFFHPETEVASFELLRLAGFKVKLLENLGAGRTMLSKGFLDQAKNHLVKLLSEIYLQDPEGIIPVVGIEPSEIYTLREELPDLFPGDITVINLAHRTWMLDEFLIRPGSTGIPRYKQLFPDQESALKRSVYVHGHCYQKSRPPSNDGYAVGEQATAQLLKAGGYEVHLIKSGCCGMAGAFGYEEEHYAVSMAIGDLSLFPALRELPQDAIVAAAGTSCRSQIVDGTGCKAYHPYVLLEEIAHSHYIQT
jgi:FAD/FMN-containing dehydrogenase/Fe-S oxidoreductase